MMYASPVDFSAKWVELGEIVHKLVRCEPISRERWNASFTDVYALCNARPVSHAPVLYSSTASIIDERVKEIVTELEQFNDAQLLPNYIRHWQVFYRGLTYLDNLYKFVNQQYVKNLRPTDAEMCYSAVLPRTDRHTMEIIEVGLAYWKIHLIDCLKDRLSACLIREISNDRLNISGHQNFIDPCIESFRCIIQLRDTDRVGMDVYSIIFQQPLLELTRNFYTQWAAEHENELSCSQYVEKALQLRTDEENRASRFYRWSSEKVYALFQEVIVKDRLEFINQSVQRAVVDENRTDLRNFFLLLSPNNLCSEMSVFFGQHVMLRVKESVSLLPKEISTGSSQFVEGLLSIRDRFIQFIDDIFDGQSIFRNQMDKAFNLVVNGHADDRAPSVSTHCTKAPNPSPSELLSRYMDSLLRRSSKFPESETESKLTSSIAIFKYINEKDTFQKYYQRMLCKRLISTHCSMELEESVINQLKAVCGYEFTSQFQRMFNDIQLIPELNNKFASHLEANHIHYKFNFYFNVLTQCSWPINRAASTDFRLPEELHQCTTQFENYYAITYQGRRMRWAHSCSTVDLSLLYTDKPYQIQVSALHAAFLLLFDTLDVDRITLGDMCTHVQVATPDPPTVSSTTAESGAAQTTTTEAMDTANSDTEIQLDQMIRILSPLFELHLFYAELDGQRHENLSKAIVQANTSVVLNREFSHKRLKLRVAHGAPAKETSHAENEQVDRQVTEDRRYFVQAALVRIMKSRKQIDHSSLIRLVIQQAQGRFQPAIPLIKRCIESLMEKDYIERSPDDPDHYNYLA